MKKALYLVAAALLGISAAQADIFIALDTPNQTGIPGDDVSFTGTITNSGPEAVFLNLDSLNFTGDNVNFTVNDDFYNVPIAVAGNGGSSGEIELFDMICAYRFTGSI